MTWTSVLQNSLAAAKAAFGVDENVRFFSRRLASPENSDDEDFAVDNVETMEEMKFGSVQASNSVNRFLDIFQVFFILFIRPIGLQMSC